MKRQTLDDICIGDKFLSDYGDELEVTRFINETYLFCDNNTNPYYDSYMTRDKELLERINDYKEK